jgi:UDP-N-acetylglucosamine acyltransferase
MAVANSARIHPSAVIDPAAEIGAEVEIGPFCHIDGPAILGSGCIMRAMSRIVGKVTLGSKNELGSGVILGERPQHLGDLGEDTELIIGDGNIFREYVTINRGSKATGKTIVGNNNYIMCYTHIGHDSRLGNNITTANQVMIAGHVTIHDRAFFGGGCGMHQNVRIGKLCFISGLTSVTRDVPPFIILAGRDEIVGVNVVGMRRAGYKTEDIVAMRKAFRIFYRTGLIVKEATLQLEQQMGDVSVVKEMITFIRESKRGVLGSNHLRGNDGKDDSDDE